MVRTTTLDALLDEAGAAGRPVWVKLDVQGSAAEILAATSGSYGQPCAIEIELPFVEMYAGEGLFLSLMSRLQKGGFELVSLEPNTFHHSDGRVLEVNGILVRSNYWDGPAAGERQVPVQEGLSQTVGGRAW